MNQSSHPAPSIASFVLEIDEFSRAGLRAVGDLRAALQEAYVQARKESGLTQQEIARRLKVNRSVIHRQLTGEENLTVRKAAEIAKAIGWEAKFDIVKPDIVPHQNEPTASYLSRDARVIPSIGTGTREQTKVVVPLQKNAIATISTSKSELYVSE